jgi:hypothetical protein
MDRNRETEGERQEENLEKVTEGERQKAESQREHTDEERQWGKTEDMEKRQRSAHMVDRYRIKHKSGKRQGG